MEQTLWIVREKNCWYEFYSIEPKKMSPKLPFFFGPEGRIVSIRPDVFEKGFPILKLEPGEKKPFTISV